MAIIRGDRLPQRLKDEVLRAYGYRHTVENEARERAWLHGTPPPTSARVTDAQWLRDHAFHVNDGLLAHTYAEPAVMARDDGRRNPAGRSRRNPNGVEALSWPMSWHTGKTTKAAFKEHCKKLAGRCDVGVWGDGRPGTLIELPAGRYVVYGGTSNPNRSPAKWYANVAVSPSGVTIT